MKKFIKKYCYIAVPIITILIYLIAYVINNKFNIIQISLNNDDSTIIQISGTLIGFLLTAITIFLSLPKDTALMERVKKHNHHKIFFRNVYTYTHLVLYFLFHHCTLDNVLI